MTVIGGPLNTGFVAPTQQQIVADLNTQVLSQIDAGLDLSSNQPIGQLIGIFAEKLAEAYEVVATAYDAMNPDAAEGRLLANISALTGTLAQTATYSTVVGTLTLAAGATVPAGSVAAVNNQPTNTWVLLTTVANSGGVTAYPTATFRSSVPGPFAANAGTLTVISTPATGWQGVTNVADAVKGLSADTDTSLRQKRVAQLAGQGGGDTDAIRAAVLKVPGVQQCFVYENTTLLPDSTGLPGKAFRVVVWDGPGLSASTTAIAQAIWAEKPSGIQPYGALSAVATDSQGNPHTIYFDRATQLPVYAVLTTTPGALTALQIATIKNNMATYAAQSWNLGVPVVALTLRASALLPGIVTDIPTFTLGFAPSPVGTANLPVSALQIATLSTTNILVDGA